MTELKATPWDILVTYWRAIRRYAWSATALWISLLLAVTTGIITPLYYKRFFDALSGGPNDATAGTLVMIIVQVLILNATGWALWRLATFLHNFVESRVMTDLRQRAFDYLMGHSYGFFADNFGGSLVQKVNRLARAFETMLDSLDWTLLPLAARIVGIMIVLWFYNPLIAGILLAWTVVFMVANFFLSQWKIKYDLRAAEQDSATTGLLADAITNHTNIQLFASFPRESRQFQEATELQRKTTKLAWDLDSMVEAIQALLMFIVEFLLFYFAIRYWRQGLISIGTFVLIQAYLLQIIGQLWDFGRSVRSIYRSIADSEEMVTILKTPHEIRDIPTAKTLVVGKGEIEFDDVEFSFHETRKILKGINLTVAGGEKIALIGPSGAGKSTIVKVLLRLYDLERGRILIDGQDIHTVTQASLRENLSMVPQDPILFHRTLLENIRYGKPGATLEEVERAAQLAHCDDFIEALPNRYDTYVGERGIKLSGGERQRVAIARAILKNAPILVLDEATSSLDSHSEALIQSALENLMRGKTVIVIAHRLSTIRTMDRIVVVDGGQIKEAGTHDALLKNPQSMYAHLWKLQAGGFLQMDEPQDEGTVVQ